MGIADKAKNAAEDLKGKAKEVVGDVTDNDELKAEGVDVEGKNFAPVTVTLEKGGA